MVTYHTPFDECTPRLLRFKIFTPTYYAGMSVTIIAENYHNIFSTPEGIWNGHAKHWMPPKGVAIRVTIPVTFDHAIPWRPLKIAAIRVTTPVTVDS
jgi:hypothetical protein